MNIPKPTPLRQPESTVRREFRLSAHATKRAAEMRLTMDQIVALVETPDVVAEHGVRSKYYGDGTVMHMRGEHTAVLNPNLRVIVTLLWRWREGWEENELGEGREVRADSRLPSRGVA